MGAGKSQKRLIRRDGARADGKRWKGGSHIKVSRNRVAGVRKGLEGRKM